MTETWIIIPARGGSQTIPNKNLHPLANRPLIHWVLARAMQVHNVGLVSRVLVSTDDNQIAAYAKGANKAIIAGRPDDLKGPDVDVALVIKDLLDQGDRLPDIAVILQPTSPFVRDVDIMACRDALIGTSFLSSQTIARVEHAAHAHNQRSFVDGTVEWLYPEDRKAGYNKQRKPLYWIFGNCLAFRPHALVDSLFLEPSAGIEIPRQYAFDVDDPLAFKIAEAMIKANIV